MKKIVALLMCIAMVVSLSACGAAKEAPETKEPEVTEEAATPAEETEGEESAVASDDKLHFVYVSPLLAHPVWLIAKDGFEQACAELGIEGDWVGPQNISPEDMSKLIETAVAQKADAIITQGLVPAAPVQTAIDAGIPVLVVDSDIPDVDRLAFFGKDVEKQAELLYESVKETVGEDEPIKASIQVAALNYQVAHDMISAVEAVFSQHPGGYELVSTTESNSDKMTSTTEWENTFQTYPEINVAINFAAEAGPACAKVVTDKGLSETVSVYGVDDTEETLELVRSGEIEGTIVTSFFNYGYQAAYWLYQHINEGKTPNEVINDAGTILVTTENVDNYADALKVKVDLQ
jgi:ABC-type sugar transport system, periplasmic component